MNKSEGLQKRSYNLAPGSVLQSMYLRERLQKLKQEGLQSFLELGSGSGALSRVFLEEGFSGVSVELNEEACLKNAEFNRDWINSNQYSIYNKNFFDLEHTTKYDIVFSSHVIEHFPQALCETYFEKCKKLLSDKGVVITLVPSGMQYWGIEDETVGHYRRFEFEDFNEIAKKHNFHISHISGLTCPISNMLLLLSNKLVRRHDGWKTKLSKDEQTKLSSAGAAKNIPWKSDFPYWVKYAVNPYTLYPLHLAQKIFSRSPRSMVIYAELKF